MRVEMVIEVEPVPQPRCRVTSRGAYQPARIVKYKQMIRQAGQLAMKGKEATEKECRVNMRLYRKYRATSRRYGDVDNLFKAITDALNGVCYKDDSQITKCTVEKYESKDCRIELEISDEEPKKT